MTPQIAPLHRSARSRQSSDSAWPLRRADGSTWAESKHKENTDGPAATPSAN